KDGTSPSITALPGGGYEMAFQANTGSLWSVGTDPHGDWGLGMKDGTSPSIAARSAGGIAMACHATTGRLRSVGADPQRSCRLGARLRDLLGEPVALEVELRAEHGDLGEVERVVLRAQERPGRGAVVDRRLGGGTPGVLELVAAERVRVPEDRVDRLVRLHAP